MFLLRLGFCIISMSVVGDRTAKNKRSFSLFLVRILISCLVDIYYYYMHKQQQHRGDVLEMKISIKIGNLLNLQRKRKFENYWFLWFCFLINIFNFDYFFKNSSLQWIRNTPFCCSHTHTHTHTKLLFCLGKVIKSNIALHNEFYQRSLLLS